MSFSFAIGVLDWLAPIVEDFKSADEVLENGSQVWLISREEGPSVLKTKRGWRTDAFLSPKRATLTLSRNWRGDKGETPAVSGTSEPSRYCSKYLLRSTETRDVNFTPTGALFRETTPRGKVMSFLSFSRL